MKPIQNKKGSIVLLILAGLVLLGFIIFNVASLIRDLKGGSKRQAEIVFAKEVLEVKHFVNLIPIGKDHYYACVDVNDKCYIVRASTDWFSKNFGSDGFAKKESVNISAPLRELKWQNKYKIEKVVADIQDSFPDGYAQYIYVEYKLENGFRIVNAVLWVLCALTFIAGIKRDNKYLVWTGLITFALAALTGYFLMARFIKA